MESMSDAPQRAGVAGKNLDSRLLRAGGVLTVDLDAIVANWRLITGRLKPGSRCAAVVKADAYGLGMAAAAPALAAAGCRRFFVATIDEGLALRALLPAVEVIVLCGPFAGTEGDFLAHRLLPVLNTPQQVADWARFARLREQPLPSVLHVDTAMSRLGLHHAEARTVAEDRQTMAAIAPMLVMSHLACADEPDDPLNAGQLAAFTAARALFPGVEGSVAASSGIFLGPDWHADWVRPGAALYGLRPVPALPNPMAQVVRLQGRIIQLREVDEGKTVGYGATHRVVAKARLATVGAGYADGIFRMLSNRGCGHVGERRVPLVGRVSMDLVVFDVTGVPAADVQPGRFIDLIGPHQSVDDLAHDARTIGYEVLTALGARYYRKYLSRT